MFTVVMPRTLSGHPEGSETLDSGLKTAGMTDRKIEVIVHLPLAKEG